MGYLTTYNASQKDYYDGNDLGNYQFTSLENIITQFQIAYVGENKLIPKLKKADVSFHAMRALQELSFDTFKSVKSQQIDLPPSLVMKLPHDYVNYTKVSCVDSAGIKHPLYPTSNTSNPFQIAQSENGDYLIPESFELITNGDFASAFTQPWNTISKRGNYSLAATLADTNRANAGARVENGQLTFQNSTVTGYGVLNSGYLTTVYQQIDVSTVDYLDVTATASSETLAQGTTVLRYGVSTDPAVITATSFGPGAYSIGPGQSTNFLSSIYNLQATAYSKDGLIDDTGGASYVEWDSSNAADGNSVVGADNSSQKAVLGVNVTGINSVYVVIVAFMDLNIQGVGSDGTNDTLNDYPNASTGSASASHPDTLQDIHSNAIGDGNVQLFSTHPNQQGYIHQSGTAPTVANIDKLSVIGGYFANNSGNDLMPALGNEKNSSTWNSYKSTNPSENNNDDYEDDTYWPANGERYGLDPEHSNVNGSYYIDQRLGRIHFSSNISGKTVILDYVSDGIGTDAEMQVHKFAEDAMYKYIVHAIMSTSSYGQALVPRLTKEKFAAIRKAKLRLSNIKLEEITQILRGKSKQIKH